MHKKNKLKAIVAIVVALAFMLPTSAMFANDVTNDVTNDVSLQVTKVRFEPPSQTVETGETFTASYYVEPTDWIIGANFVTISFDPTLLEANSVSKGTFFGGKEIMFSGGTIDNTLGTISDGFALVLKEDAVNADGSVFVIEFTAKDKDGISALTMSGVTVKNNTGVSVPVTVESGSVTVGETVMLTMGVSGNGTTVPAPGVHTYTPGTVVNLTATPDIGWSFDHWTGDVANASSATTNITMDANETVTAYFTEDCYILSVSTVGNGTVDVVPDKTCYLYGESVNLTAVADPHWTFKEWSGDLTGDGNPETIIMDGDKAVTATFIIDQCVLDITIIGRGTVTKNPDQETYDYGTSVELTAVPDTYWTFDSWSGDLSGNETHETIIMDGDKDVTATFIGDTEPPNTEIIVNGTMGENGWYISVVKVTLIATDDWSGVDSTWYKIDSGITKWYVGEFEVSGDLKHTVEYYSIDRAGNRESEKSALINIDITPPVTTHEFDGLMGDSGWFISNVTVTLSARDVTAGVNYTMYKIDDGNWINYTEPFNVTEDGEYIISYYSVDLAGHVEDTNEAILKIEKDLIPPVTNHSFSGIMGDNGWYVSDVTVTLTATDNAAGVDYTMYKLEDDTEWQEYTGPILVREDGEHTIEYYSVDKVKNKENNTGPFGFKIDKTVPTIELTWDGENYLLIADVSDETSGIAKVEFYVNDEYLGEATESPYELEVPNPRRGDQGQAIVYDKAGNENISERIDAVPQGTSQSQSSSSTSTSPSWLFGLW